MRRNLKVNLFLSIILCAFAGVMIGGDGRPQTPDGPGDVESLSQGNTRNAVVMMRALASAQVAYRAGAGNGEFGTEVDLFKDEFIDADFAGALGCPRMTSAKGQVCAGTRAPLRGYFYRLKVTRSAPGESPGFSAVGVPAVPKGKMRTGEYSFFVDQTQVIRASDSPTVEASAKSFALGTSQAPRIRH
jgi:hypothetical protein